MGWTRDPFLLMWLQPADARCLCVPPLSLSQPARGAEGQRGAEPEVQQEERGGSRLHQENREGVAVLSCRGGTPV